MTFDNKNSASLEPDVVDPNIYASLLAMLSPLRTQRIENVLKERTSSLTIVLDRVFHEHNISAVLRSADAFGISKIHLLAPNFSSQKGISLGTERWVDIHLYNEADALVKELKTQGFKIIGLVPPEAKDQVQGSGNSKIIPITEIDFTIPTALVFGSEGEGISEALISACDVRAFIPMFGFVESLNVSVACALTLFCSRLVVSGINKNAKDLSPEETKEKRWDWIKKSVYNSETIVSQLTMRNSNKA